jgi:hypothetical protein
MSGPKARCEICGKSFDTKRGIGPHRRMHRRALALPEPKLAPKPEKKAAWTITLVNGKRQIAATVPAGAGA